MIIPKTYSEIATLAACNAYAKCFALDEALFEKIYYGLRSGAIERIDTTPTGNTVIEAADGRQELQLQMRIQFDPSIYEEFSLTKAAFAMRYTAAYLARIRSSGSSGGGGSSNNNNNNNNNNNH